MPNPSATLIKAIAVTAEICGKEFSPDAARVFAADLSAYPEASVLKALERCRKESNTFTLAAVISRIEDGRPGPEEAWAMIPKDEQSTTVWTDEMRDAFFAARPLLNDDEIAARMAFKETYTKLVTEARAVRKPVQWQVTLGLNKATHEPALRRAVEKGQLTHEQVQHLLPGPPKEERILLSGPVEENNLIELKTMLAKIKESIISADSMDTDPVGPAFEKEGANIHRPRGENENRL